MIAASVDQESRCPAPSSSSSASSSRVSSKTAASVAPTSINSTSALSYHISPESSSANHTNLHTTAGDDTTMPRPAIFSLRSPSNNGAASNDRVFYEEQPTKTLGPYEQENLSPPTANHPDVAAVTHEKAVPSRSMTQVETTPLPPRRRSMQSMPADFQSPTTRVFAQMLGAADMIATDPRRDTNDLLDEEEESRPPTQRNLLANASFASSLGPDETQQDLVHGGSSLASQSGRKYSKKRAADDEAPLEEGNPFLELERDPELYKKVVVKMALQRHIYEEGHVKEQDANVSPIIRDGFFWRNYPTCEQVLYDNMREYYRVSNGQPQSKLQFNNMLVRRVREAAAAANLEFEATFHDKKLRDRIRCFYKTHLQNAKKRLVTLQKHPHSYECQANLRVYIRCVRTGCSLEEAQLQEPSLCFKASGRKNKHRRSSLSRPSLDATLPPAADDSATESFHRALTL